MLLHENGNEKNGAPQRTPLYVDGDYLLGPEAGHLNITGMSGLSTKTSHALFTISSTFQTVKDKKVAALMFNVKGADLLFLDKPVEVDPKDDPELADRYEKAGQQEASRPRTGRCTRRWASRWHRSRSSASSRPRLRTGPAGEHGLSRRTYRRGSLNTLRTARGEDTNVHPILWDLGDVLPHAGRIFDPTDYGRQVPRLHGVPDQRPRRGPWRTSTGDQSDRDYFDGKKARTTRTGTDTIRRPSPRSATASRVLPNKCGGLLVNGRVNYGDFPRVDGPFEDSETGR